jgi:hypothetical protein
MSNIVLSASRVADINREAPKLAKYYYVNGKKKVSYYRKNTFAGHFDVYNKGTKRWEYAAAVTEDRLILLPAISTEEFDQIVEPKVQEVDYEDLSISETLALGSVSQAEEYAKQSVKQEKQVVVDIPEAEVVVTKILCNTIPTTEIPEDRGRRRRIRKEEAPAAVNVVPGSFSVTFVEEPKKEEEDKTSSITQIDQKRLLTLFNENLPEGFILKFTPQELNYYAAYNYMSRTWTVENSRQIQTIGTIYTNSLTCIHKVVDELNHLGYTL